MATKIVDVRKDRDEASALPATSKVFHVTWEDPETRQTYGGDFTVRRMTIGDMRRIGIRKAEMNGGQSTEALDKSIGYVNAMLAHLEVALVKRPEWWKPDNFYSADLIAQVYEEVMKFEDSFRVLVPEKGTSAAEASAPVAEA
jgi:hypothetical protein